MGNGANMARYRNDLANCIQSFEIFGGVLVIVVHNAGMVPSGAL